MNSNNNIITDNDTKNVILFRKPINKVMNINYLKTFSNTKNLDYIISLYSSRKSYISPKSKILKRKKIDNDNKEINRKISPNQQKDVIINKNIKNNLDNPKVNGNSKVNKKEIKKYNYKRKVNLNKHKLNTNKDNNLILGSLIDNETEGTFDNNSLEKAKANKIKNFIINENEKNKNNRNNIFDMGSISHISKNGSSSAKDKKDRKSVV